MNTFGSAFRLTVFGESHGKVVGALVDGCPPGLAVKEEEIQRDLDRRAPGRSLLATQRKEPDRLQVLSGVKDGHTTGAPVVMVVANEDVQSRAYDDLRFVPRPGHSDYPAFVKYGGQNDFRGGGQFSGRMTAAFVMAGGLAKALLGPAGVRLAAHTVRIADVSLAREAAFEELARAYDDPTRCVDSNVATKMAQAIEAARRDQDSVGGVVECRAIGLPVGLGEPFFTGLEQHVSQILFSVPAVKGVEFGAGFALAGLRGSQSNDPFALRDGRVVTTKNDMGGILGGLATGMPLVVRAAVKPTSSIAREQPSVDLSRNEETIVRVKGRHDPCIVPRAVVAIECAVAVALADLFLRGGYDRGHP
ncbi:MAG TPA: chorismate synthase [Candidatus Thermoplasmatota archaeon]|nr:chorismate synthase [Candidatus Thermoplasmatota archaeon]